MRKKSAESDEEIVEIDKETAECDVETIDSGEEDC